MTILEETRHAAARVGASYRAYRATGAGALELVRLPVAEPEAGQVRISVETCGICHTDAFTVEGGAPGLSYPRVPGHEVIGRIDALGAGVSGWNVGERVGVGFLAGRCGHCVSCRRGDFVNCSNQQLTGIHSDGGYAELMIASESGLVSIPDGLSAVEAAPLLCAGLTTFNALRNSPARAGSLVAIHGLGGLGHLAVQFSRRMGFHTIAIARGSGKAELAKQLGAHAYIDSEAQDAAAALQELGGAAIIVTTVSNPSAMAPLVAGLGPKGRLIVVGGGVEPLEVNTLALLFGERSIAGSLTGSTIDAEDTLAFSLLQDVRPIVETYPLAEAPQAYARMLRNEARFRIVLTTGA